VLVPIAAALLAILNFAVAEPAGPTTQPTTRPVATIPRQVLAELRAANAARAERLTAEQAWALEKEKLELLAATVRREADRFTAAAAKAKSDEAALKTTLAAARATQQRIEAVEAMIDTLAERLEQALERLAGRALPGLVPPDRAAGITDPPARLAAAVSRLDQTERQARKAGVELVTGTLAGEPVTVKLLRAGGVAAWWMSLDGKQTGQAVMADGKLSLTPASTEADGKAIRQAFGILEGQAAPTWSALPAGHVKVAPPGGKP